MAFNKKNKRRITVKDKEYYWSARGSDGWISLCIMADVQSGSRLICQFDYHYIQIEKTSNGKSFTSLTNQFVITPYTVEQVIKYALSLDWKPFEKGADLHLGNLGDKINLRLDKNRANNFIK